MKKEIKQIVSLLEENDPQKLLDVGMRINIAEILYNDGYRKCDKRVCEKLITDFIDEIRKKTAREILNILASHGVDKEILDNIMRFFIKQGGKLMKFELNEEQDGYTLIEGDDVPTVDIPREYDGKPVTSIGNYAFYNCESLESVIIPNTVTSIGNYAFYCCESLKSVTIGNGVTSIGKRAFWGCESLKSVTIPNSVTNIGDWAFYNCRSLESVYYNGDKASWDKISFENEWANPLYYGATLHLATKG